ncbi:Stp1/IreP family PP2C-type Ser/Thr phosphatase [Thermodesulfobacteriota bacterium]
MNRIIIGAATDPGLEHNENQDSYAFYSLEKGSAPKKGILMVLADGMGGHSGGAIAAKITVDVLMQTYYEDNTASITESLKKSFLKANQKVIERGKDDLKLQGLGSTLVSVVFKGDQMYFANVGDSRGYSIYANEISQFTEDHSYVASLVKAGAISAEEALTHPEGNIITRAIGFEEDLSVDTSQESIKIKKDQYILLCCDGLYRVVSDQEILATVNEYKDPDIISKKLIEMANANGGPDNITVLIARIESVDSTSNWLNKFMGLLR